MARCLVALLLVLLFPAVEHLLAGEIPAPWASLEIKGNTVSCWGRNYRFDGTLLPARISSQERNILAAPVKLAAVVNGRELNWKQATFKSTGKSSEAVDYGTKASAAGVTARCEFSTEFDGCTRVELTLESPAPLKIDSLDLIVPLRPAHAQFFHHSSTLPVYVWDWPKKQLNAGRVGEQGLKLPFVYFIWLGSDEGGLQMFAESDQALAPAEPTAVVTVTPGRETSVLRFHLLSNYTLNGSWHWTFGFMATPVKAYPRDVSSLRYCQMGGYGIEDHYWGDKPPADGYPPALDLLKASGVNYVGFHENWSEQQSLPRPKEPARLVSLINGCHTRGMGLVLYTGCWADMTSPEFTNRWEMPPLADHYQYQRPDNTHICRACCNDSGYSELLISSYGAALAKWGFDGLYLDGLTSPLPCLNTNHGCGYLGRDGQTHPTMPIWRSRELVKNLRGLFTGRNRPGILVAHTSGTVLLPVLSFADTYLDGEHLGNYFKMGAAEFPEVLMRSEMYGRNFGIPCTQLPVRGTAPEVERGRTLSLLYDSLVTWSQDYQKDIWRAWKAFGMDGARWLPWWDSKALASCNASDFRISAYVQDKRGALLVVANLGTNQSVATVTLRRKACGLGAQRLLETRDESTGQAMASPGDTFSIPVNAGSFKLISVQAR